MAIPRRKLQATVEISTARMTVLNEIPLFTGENGATEVEITLLNGGDPYSIESGTFAEMYFYYPNSPRMTGALPLQPEGNILKGQMLESMMLLEGHPLFCVQITDDETQEIICTCASPVQIVKTRGNLVISEHVPSPSEVIYVSRVPYVDPSTEHWFVWNADTSTFVDSGVVARGQSAYIDNQTNHWMIFDDATGTFIDSGISAVGTGVGSVNNVLPDENGNVELYATDIERSNTDSRSISSAVMTVNSRTPDASGNVVISTGDAGNVGGMELYAIIQPAQWTAITGGYRYAISNSDIQLGMNVVEVWLDDESVQTSTMEVTVPQDGQCRIDIVTKPTSNLGVHISLVRDGAQVIEDITENLAGAIAKVLEGDTNSTGATVTSGTYVYLRGHSTLSEGLYKASSDIANGASLSGSNLTSMVGGGINLLSSDLDAIGARIERKNSSVLTYAANTNQLWSFYSTVSGQADNPTSSGSYLFLVFSFTTGRTIFGIGLGTYEVHINKSTNGGATWSGWKLLSTTTDYITTLAEIFGSTSILPNDTVARCRRNGRTINLYLGMGNNSLSSSETSVVIGTLIEGLRPGYNVICPLYSRSSPYLPVGTAWIDTNGKITVYKTASVTGGYISMTYNAQ